MDGGTRRAAAAAKRAQATTHAPKSHNRFLSFVRSSYVHLLSFTLIHRLGQSQSAEDERQQNINTQPNQQRSLTRRECSKRKLNKKKKKEKTNRNLMGKWERDGLLTLHTHTDTHAAVQCSRGKKNSNAAIEMCKHRMKKDYCIRAARAKPMRAYTIYSAHMCVSTYAYALRGAPMRSIEHRQQQRQQQPKSRINIDFLRSGEE